MHNDAFVGLERARVRYIEPVVGACGMPLYDNCKTTEAHEVCCDELAGMKIGHLFHKVHVS